MGFKVLQESAGLGLVGGLHRNDWQKLHLTLASDHELRSLWSKSKISRDSGLSSSLRASFS